MSDEMYADTIVNGLDEGHVVQVTGFSPTGFLDEFVELWCATCGEPGHCDMEDLRGSALDLALALRAES
jgi:hypothetical protein